MQTTRRRRRRRRRASIPPGTILQERYLQRSRREREGIRRSSAVGRTSQRPVRRLSRALLASCIRRVGVLTANVDVHWMQTCRYMACRTLIRSRTVSQRLRFRSSRCTLETTRSAVAAKARWSSRRHQVGCRFRAVLVLTQCELTILTFVAHRRVVTRNVERRRWYSGSGRAYRSVVAPG